MKDKEKHREAMQKSVAVRMCPACRRGGGLVLREAPWRRVCRYCGFEQPAA